MMPPMTSQMMKFIPVLPWLLKPQDCRA